MNKNIEVNRLFQGFGSGSGSALIELLDPDPDPHTNCGSGFGSRRAKMTPKNRKKGPADRELMDEDDTQSFEALELRLKTPMRPVPKSRVSFKTPCYQVKGGFQHDCDPDPDSIGSVDPGGQK